MEQGSGHSSERASLPHDEEQLPSGEPSGEM